MEYKFYRGPECGCVAFLAAKGEKECFAGLEVLEADTTDAAQEKHVPEIKREGNKVEVVVGSVEHPMEEKHYIQFIALAQGEKVQIQHLNPGDAPKATFTVEDGPVVVYEYCNLHGLWKNEA